jgi:stalled ribosome rescue protein Dom34
MNMRIRSRWRASQKPAGVEDNAKALANATWRIALGFAKKLHSERFDYQDDAQRIAVIGEYLAFLVHVADRRACNSMDQEQRARFVTTLGQETARYLHQNQADIMGPGDYRNSYLRMLNARMAEYAETRFDDDGTPGYSARRCLGDKIQTVMGNSQTNRWVIDQVMEIDADEALSHLRTAMDNLLQIDPD